MKLLYKLCLMLCLCIAPSLLQAQITNGSFETWSGNTPTGWTTIDGGIAVAQNTSITRAGSSSARIMVNTTTQGSTDFRQTIAVTPGQSYTVSTWVYHTEGGVRARLYVDGYRNYSNQSQRNQWQQISYTHTPAGSSMEIGLRFYDVSGFDGSEIVYVDDFQPASGGSGGGGSGGGGGTGCTDTEVTLSLNTDNYGSETSWTIKSGSTTLHSGSGYSNNRAYTETFCLADGNYTFTINDSYGDGICCSWGNGSYSLDAGSTNFASGGAFGSTESTSFSIGGSTGGGGGGTGGGGGAGGTGYYASADGLSGYALKTALHNIINNHTSQGYSAIWTFYNSHELDYYYENDGKILDIYSENPTGADPFEYTKSTNQCGTYSGEGSCYNREHSFPKSWFGGTIEPMNSDVHHIFASDGYVNGRRSSFPYGEVGSATYTSSNGSKLGSARSGLGYSGTVFEPIDEFKGDLARAHFYMATRYEDRIAGWESISSYGNAVMNGTSNQAFETWALNMLISWHNADPVSQKEIDRNNAAQTHQGNRNPFVDHPEYVGLIWGGAGARTAGQTLMVSSTSPLSTEEVTISYSDSKLTLSFGRQPVQEVTISDINGRVLYKNTVVEGSSLEVPATLQQQSIYLISLQTPKTRISRKLMLVD